MKKVGCPNAVLNQTASDNGFGGSRTADFSVAQIKDIIYEVTVTIEDNISAGNGSVRSHSPFGQGDQQLNANANIKNQSRTPRTALHDPSGLTDTTMDMTA